MSLPRSLAIMTLLAACKSALPVRSELAPPLDDVATEEVVAPEPEAPLLEEPEDPALVEAPKPAEPTLDEATKRLRAFLARYATRSTSRVDCAALATGIASVGKLPIDGGDPANDAFRSILGAELPESENTRNYASSLVVVRDRAGIVERSKRVTFVYYTVDVATADKAEPSAGLIAEYEALREEVAACMPAQWSRELGVPKFSLEGWEWVRDGVTPSKPNEARFRHADDEYDRVCRRLKFGSLCERHYPSVFVGISTFEARTRLTLRIDVEY